MRPAIAEPESPDGIEVVGAESPPTATRTNQLSRLVPEVESASVHPDGVDGTESAVCVDATTRTSSSPAVGVDGYAGVMLVAPVLSAPAAL
jgi:hypothetical protein